MDERSPDERGYWIAQHHCTRCKNLLDKWARMYSDGVCPYCGLDSGSTICETVNSPIFVPRKTFWQRLCEILQ